MLEDTNSLGAAQMVSEWLLPYLSEARMTIVALLVSVLMPLLVRSKNDNCGFVGVSVIALLVRSKNDNCGFVGVSVIAPTCQKQE